MVEHAWYYPSGLSVAEESCPLWGPVKGLLLGSDPAVVASTVCASLWPVVGARQRDRLEAVPLSKFREEAVPFGSCRK